MIAWTEIVTRLLLAACLGAIIGLERERKDWVAGLRTHMMVCLGSCLTIIVSAYGFNDVLGKPGIALDPSRIAAQVISGIGFIGAGTILFLRQGTIRGLTTASGLWTVAAIGLATGGGMYFAASITTILAVIILFLLQPVEKRFSNRFKRKSVRVVATDEATLTEVANTILHNSSIEISELSVTKGGGEFVLSFRFNRFDKAELTGLVSSLQADPKIKEVNWNE